MASKFELLCERSALRLAEAADARLAAGDVPGSVMALGGALGLAFVCERCGVLEPLPKKTARRAIAGGRKPRRHHRGS